jgi:polyhydroxyalkanoate synthesis regulator phasin
MIFRPLVGLVTMTLLLAIYFLIDGISEIVAAFKIKPDQGWGWVLFNGIIAVLLGFMIWRQWPVSGAWAIGLLVGIHILMTGWSMIILGSGARRVAGAIEDAVEDAVEAAGDVAEKAADIAEDAVDKAKDMAEDAADAAEDMVDKAKDFAGDVADKTEDVVDDVVDKAKDTFGGDKD